MGIRGDFDELNRLKQKVADAARAGLKERVLKAAAAEARTQIALEFRQGVDPDGKPWAPLKFRRGQILRLTGRLANSFTATVTSNGFRVGTNVEYAHFHQQGTKGHKAHTRAQAAGKGGKFISKKAAGKAKSGFVRLTQLNFKQGGGALPKRPMVPEGQLSARWAAAIDKAVDVAVRNFFTK